MMSTLAPAGACVERVSAVTVGEVSTRLACKGPERSSRPVDWSTRIVPPRRLSLRGWHRYRIVVRPRTGRAPGSRSACLHSGLGLVVGSPIMNSWMPASSSGCSDGAS